MTAKHKARVAALADELRSIQRHGLLDPSRVVTWAQKHPSSELHASFQWDDTRAAHAYRVWQARELITSVQVVYGDNKTRQVYVSLMADRSKGGYAALADVMTDAKLRRAFLEQALDELNRMSMRYRDLKELAGVFAAVKRVRRA